MKVPFQLRRRTEPLPAAALLLPSNDVAALLDLCARVAATRVFATAGGFLLELNQPSSAAFPGVIRLRRLADRLYLPADADLVPLLFDDEMLGLVRERGLVFLPGGRVLGFDFHQPLPLSALLDVGPVERGPWQPLPEPEYLAPRIESIAYNLPQPPADEILASGAGDIGSESPDLKPGGFLDTAASKAQAGIGKGLMGLGNLLGWKGMAQFGANLIAGAVAAVPALSESILGKQEAALRELLRWFREGKLDEALKRALPLGGSGDRGGTPATGWQLPWHQLRYSLSSLLGGGSGPASVWFGGYDVQNELAREYRRAAEQAIQQGDHRRAAFIFGKLLHDYRRAADVLNQGGLFRDAALLYLHKLDDRLAAARTFEAAGDIDQAVQLYRQQKQHVAAGDVLRRAGEEEAALAEYRVAAELLIASNEHLAAGELVLGKTDQVDWAESIFSDGWRRRPEVNATACGLRLARLHADTEAPDKLLALTKEARAFYDRPGNEVAAGEFLNHLARLADRPALSASRGTLRDQAKVGLAIKARQRVLVESKPADIVSRLLGQSAAWPAPVVSDAAFAVKALAKRVPQLPEPRPATRLRLGVGTVTATCWAPLTGEVFAAFDYGKICCFRPASSELVVIRERWDYADINSMAVDTRGEILLSVGSELSRYMKRPSKQFHLEQSIPNPDLHAFSFAIQQWDNRFLALGWNAHDGSPELWSIDQLVPLTEWECLADRHEALFVKMPNGTRLCFTAKRMPGYLWDGQNLELTWIEQDLVLKWKRLQVHSIPPLQEKAQHSIVSPHGYRACAIVRPGLLAGVTEKGIDWLRTGGKYASTGAATPLPLGDPIAAYASPLTGEVLIICKDGLLERVMVPVVASS